MSITGRWRRTSPLLAATTALAVLIVLPGGPAASQDPDGVAEPVPAGPELAVGALIEVEDADTLHHLEDQGFDLAHWNEQLPSGRTRGVAFVTPTQLDELRTLDVEIVETEALPTMDEVASQRLGNVDPVAARERTNRGQGRGANAVGKQPPIDESGPLRVLRADTFTNYAGDFLNVEVRNAGGANTGPAAVLAVRTGAAVGTYTVVPAAFGPAFSVAGTSGDLVVVDAGGENPSQGCAPLIGFPAGAIAIADRGGCPFVEIVANAQAAGASAVVIANNAAGAPIAAGGTDPSITIPAGMVSLADAETLKAGLPAAATLRAGGLVASWEIDGTEYSRAMVAFNDAGQYIYHRFPRSIPVEGVPTEVTVTLGDDSVTVPTSPWSEWDSTGYPDGFQWGFIDTGYPDAVDSTEKIEQLAAEFPDLAEIIELPYETHGYRRPAMRLMGGTTANVVNVRSLAYGHEGGNDLTIAIVNPGAADSPLSVSVTGSDITVSSATNAAGALTSTAAQIVAAINAHPEVSTLVTAHTYRGNTGTGVTPAVARANLSDFLNAPEDKISREPATVKAIRIGKHRDGSRTGVFAYSQEHAREWVTPVVALEAAERLLRNYGSDPDSTRFVDELDVFIIPVVNPDGTNYSLYDNLQQRRNMANYCPDAQRDANYRNNWGVDLNRNFSVGSLFDGYNGASASCISDVFAGPSELSEPETRNEVWLTETYDNIRFSMNIHSFGGYFMWAPGAYITPGRIPLPRPNVAVEDYFFDASQTILSRIAEHRGTVIEPGRTGPTIDVLYSAAGNSADQVWYAADEDEPIFAWNFEVGADRFTGAGGTGWVTPGQFWPNFEAEGFDQAMEFANGIYGLLEVAADFQQDTTRPVSRPNVTNGGWYSGAVDVEFETSEPAVIYYTTDGSRPTFDSATVERRDVRDSAAPIRIEATTTLRWFSVDMAGNIEGGYDPAGRGNNDRRVQVRIR